MSVGITRPTHVSRGQPGVPVPVRPESRRRERGLIRRFLAAMMSLALLIAGIPAVAAAGIYGYVQLTDTVVPGVWVDSLPVEGLTLQQASAEIDRIWNKTHTLKLIDNTDVSRTWQVSPSEIGLAVDAKSTARLALSVGRERDILQALSSLYTSKTQRWSIHPIVTLDSIAARAGLEAWAARALIAPVDGFVRIEGTNVSAEDGRAGKALDMQATEAFLTSNADAVMTEYNFIPLIMKFLPPAVGSVSEASGQAQRLMNASFTLRAYDPVADEWFEWTPGLEIIAGWLEVERLDQSPAQAALSIELIQDRMADYIAGLNESLGGERFFDLEEAMGEANAGLGGSPTQPILIHYRRTTRQAGAGENWISIGWKIGIPPWRLQDENPQAAGRNPLPGETINIPARDANLVLPIVWNKRIVISIAEQHMWVYEDGELRSDHVVSTGIARSPTMPGVFQIESHYENAYASNWDLWMPHFLGIYDALPGFTNGIHGLPMLSSGVRLWANVLGRPASFGCIILDLDAAEELYNWAEDGVIVEITP